MVETTLHIRAGECDIATNSGGETEQQAELVAFGHYVARIVSTLGPARAGAVVKALHDGVHEAAVELGREASVVVRFVDGASGPRIYFRLKADGTPSSVRVLLDALHDRHRDDARFQRRLAHAATLLGRLGATGQIRPENEFDVALAAADVAWRSAQTDDRPLDLACPACGNADAFELRVWPSETALLRRCSHCRAGVWKRRTHPARLIRADLWAAMEAMRAELSGKAGADWPLPDGTQSLLTELKRVFAEHGWPYSEVDGAPVLVTELSGPEGQWDFYAQAVEEKGLILLYSIAPQHVPDDRRRAVAEFLTRANYGLADGNFELDFEDGEVRYKTVLHVQGDELDSLLVKRLVRANGTALETYLPSIAAVTTGATAR
jgi:hypothetical protein